MSLARPAAAALLSQCNAPSPIIPPSHRWGLAGHKGGLLVEGLGGDWSLMGREEQVRGLLDSLEVRVRHTRGGGRGELALHCCGTASISPTHNLFPLIKRNLITPATVLPPQGVNECELHRALSKALPAILAVVKRIPQPEADMANKASGDAAGGTKKAAPKELPVPARVQPSRRGKPSDLKEGGTATVAAPEPPARGAAGGKKGSAKAAPFATVPLETRHWGPKEVSLQYCFDRIDELAAMASAAKVRRQGRATWPNLLLLVCYFTAPPIRRCPAPPCASALSPHKLFCPPPPHTHSWQAPLVAGRCGDSACAGCSRARWMTSGRPKCPTRPQRRRAVAQHHRFVGGQVLQGEVDDEWAAQVPHTTAEEEEGSGATPQVCWGAGAAGRGG